MLSTKAPTAMPDGMAAISNPTVTALPCKECAYGAASPSGTMYKLASQPNSIRVSSLRSPKTIRNPSADTRPQGGPRRLAPRQRPRSHSGHDIKADIPNETASKPSVRYTSTTATRALLPGPPDGAASSAWPAGYTGARPARNRTCPPSARSSVRGLVVTGVVHPRASAKVPRGM